MNILGVTLARGGSKGVPNKHTRDLCGRPMIAWTIEAALQAQYINHYAVSTDDLEIAKISAGYGVHVISRPKELALDTTPTMPALIHAVRAAEGGVRDKFDLIVEIRATSPLKTAGDISTATYMLAKSDADSVIGVTPVDDHHPARMKWLDDQGRIRSFLPESQLGRRQDLTPKAYVRNGTIYALRREWVMGPTPKLFGHENSLAYVMPPERSVNIDTELDWTLAEALMRK